MAIVNLCFTTNGVGGGSMKLQLAVDSVKNTLNGKANGDILKGTQHSHTFTASGCGHVHSTGLGNVTKLGAISGEASVDFTPPAIGQSEAQFTASFAVDNEWKGKGKFSVGKDTYECEVTLTP